MRFISKVLVLIVLISLSLTSPTFAIDAALKPTNLHIVSVTDSAVTLQWDEINNSTVTGYRLFLLENSEYNLVEDTITESATCTYNYSPLNTNQINEFSFILASIDKNNTVLAMSDALTIHLSASSASASPSTTAAAIGNRVRYSIQLSSLTNAVSASFILTYNPSVVQAVYTDNNLVSAGSLFQNGLSALSHDPQNGTIQYSLSQQNQEGAPVEPYNGDGILGNIEFKVVQQGTPDITLESVQYITALNDDIDTLVPVLCSTSAETFSIAAAKTIDVSAFLQYRSSIEGILITVKDVDSNIIASSSTIVDDKIKINLLPGTYTFQASASGYLDAEKDNVIITDETAQVDMGTLTAGDINNDNIINIDDLNILRTEYTGQRQTLLSDFNNDGAVDLIDLTILGINYNKTGPTR